MARHEPSRKGTEPAMRDGIIIQEQACPRCAIRRTARLGYGASLCFNCHFQWPTDAARLPNTTELPSPLFVFASDELARLSVYRTAVRDGFYTDWIDRSSTEITVR
jgi:hypothetical protein